MKNILITGNKGFIGKNLQAKLMENKELNLKYFNRENSLEDLDNLLPGLDIIYHLAGVSRPEDNKEFINANCILLDNILKKIKNLGLKIPIVFTSSVQASLNTPYGESKKKAEDLLIDYSNEMKVSVFIYRLQNSFGKWCKPNYSSVVATFCYNISHNLDIIISDKDKILTLAYIDDVIEELIKCLNEENNYKLEFREIKKTYKITLGDLANKIRGIKESREKSIIPEISNPFMKALYSTYLTYLDKEDIISVLDEKKDEKGIFLELIKSNNLGQISISYSESQVIRGNHYHHTKTEKFFVLRGNAIIKQRPFFDDKTIEFEVSDKQIQAVDIIPGCVHNIKNTGNEKMILLIWSSEVYDQDNPDTYYCEV